MVGVIGGNPKSAQEHSLKAAHGDSLTAKKCQPTSSLGWTDPAYEHHTRFAGGSFAV